jgi:hypothetical protein
MFVFKTSGTTIGSVVANQRHAFVSQPKDWNRRELILVCKTRVDLAPGEKQIQYTMRFSAIRLLKPGEAERYWPGTEGRWKYIVECTETHRLRRPFELSEAIGANAQSYAPVVTFKKCPKSDEALLVEFLRQADADVL